VECSGWKHAINKDALPPTKGRANPLTGYINFIPVTGDLWESYNILAIISGNPTKPHPVQYRIVKENGMVETFVHFITALIISVFLCTKRFLWWTSHESILGGKQVVLRPFFFGTWKSMVGCCMYCWLFTYRHAHLNSIQLSLSFIFSQLGFDLSGSTGWPDLATKVSLMKWIMCSSCILKSILGTRYYLKNSYSYYLKGFYKTSTPLQY
jgi:hypothetical protein